MSPARAQPLLRTQRNEGLQEPGNSSSPYSSCSTYPPCCSRTTPSLLSPSSAKKEEKSDDILQSSEFSLLCAGQLLLPSLRLWEEGENKMKKAAYRRAQGSWKRKIPHGALQQKQKSSSSPRALAKARLLSGRRWEKDHALRPGPRGRFWKPHRRDNPVCCCNVEETFQISREEKRNETILGKFCLGHKRSIRRRISSALPLWAWRRNPSCLTKGVRTPLLHTHTNSLNRNSCHYFGTANRGAVPKEDCHKHHSSRSVTTVRSTMTLLKSTASNIWQLLSNTPAEKMFADSTTSLPFPPLL